jgi:2,4-dienoyl-CoA reductase-like NADH-dependent reductase (Old Yellow Enzyme family)
LTRCLKVVDAVHAQGVRLFAQLSHCGRQVIPRFAQSPEAYSASDVKDLLTGTRPLALTLAQIQRLVGNYADAAERCRHAGIDGVQLHSANGYLLSQFLTPYTNRRTDEYGGSIENRTRFIREIIQAMRERLGPAFPVIVNMNGSDRLPLRDGLKTDELAEAAVILQRAGIDAVEISVGHYESGFPMVRGTFDLCLRNILEGSISYLPPMRRTLLRVFRPLVTLASDLIWKGRQGYNVDYTPQFKSKLAIPVIRFGGFRTRDAMEAAISRGKCDAVSAGRAFIADPYLYRPIRDNQPGTRCVDCNACVGYLGVQPAESYHPLVKAEKDAMLAREAR